MTNPATIAAQIAESLREDREEGKRHGETVASSEAVRACQTLAGTIAELLSDPPEGLKWAAFGEKGGGVALVLQSSKTDRRVDFPFRIDKPGIVHAVCIDEDLNAETVPVAIRHASVIRGLAEWVANE